MYREFDVAPELAGFAVCGWTHQVDTRGGSLILPDGHVDLVASTERGLFVAGPDTRAWAGDPALGTRMVGVRLRPGLAGPFLGHEASNLQDSRVPLGDLLGGWGHRLERELLAALGVASELDQDHRSLHLLQEAVAERAEVIDGEEDVLNMVDLITTGQIMTAPITAERNTAGLPHVPGRLGDRQLRRRFVADVGYRPKLFQRVVRFRRFLDRIADHDVATAAVDAGYADQAHATRESRQLSGLTPGRLRQRWYGS